MDDNSETPPADQLATQHVCVDDIGTHLVDIESVQQTIKEHLSELKTNGMETSVLKLESVLTKLDSLQTSLRKTAPPIIQDLHIFNLPDELLRKIFEHVAGGKCDYGSIARSDSRSIMSWRLVCHRFCDTSSHLLLYQVDVSITKASLDHLEEVSRHLTISRGVKSLRICVGLYDSYMALSLYEFTVEGERTMREHLRVLKAMLGISLRPENQFSGELPVINNITDLQGVNRGMLLKFMNLSRGVEQYSQILRSWKKYIRAGLPEQDEDVHVVALRRAYERYKQLLSDQQGLLQGNAFFQRVATAVARIPTISDVSIDDTALGSRGLSMKGLGPIDELVQKDLLKPHSWSLYVLEQLAQSRSSVDFLYQLPLAVGRAGSSLTALHINFTPALDLKLNLGEKKVIDTIKSAQHLRVLSIKCFSYETIDTVDEEDHSSG